VSCGKCKEACGCEGFFDSLHHAYVEMAWYFGVMVVAALAFAVAGFVLIDKGVNNAEMVLVQSHAYTPDTTDANGQYKTITYESWEFPCQILNSSLQWLAWGEVAEGVVALLIAFTIASIMRSQCFAVFGLINIALYVLVLLGKLAISVLSVLWVWGENTRHCRSQTTHLYNVAQYYLIGYLSFFAFQLLFGTAFLVCCGMADAVKEGMFQVTQSYRDYDREDLDEGYLDHPLPEGTKQ